MKYQVGDIANGQESSKQIVEGGDYVTALENLLTAAGLYCKPVDIEAKTCKDDIDEFIRTNMLMGSWTE